MGEPAESEEAPKARTDRSRTVGPTLKNVKSVW